MTVSEADLRLVLDSYVACDRERALLAERVSYLTDAHAIEVGALRGACEARLAGLEEANRILRDEVAALSRPETSWWGARRGHLGYLATVAGTSAAAGGVAAFAHGETTGGAILLALGLALDVAGLVLIW